VPPARLRVTGLGAAVLVVAALAALVALRLGWAEAAALATGLGALVALAVASVLRPTACAVELRPAADRVRAGERALLVLRVRSTARGRSLPHTLTLDVGTRTARVRVPALAAGEAWEELLVVPAARRGVLAVGPVRSERGGALGLLRRTVRWTAPLELVVHPRTVALTAAPAGALRDLEGVAVRVLTEGQQSFHALREYVPGDDRRAVHWRTSAHRGQLMVRQDEDVRRTRLVVLLPGPDAGGAVRPDHGPDGPDGPDRAADRAADLETAVEVAASLALGAVRAGREVVVLAGDETLPVGSPTRLLDGLARFDPAGPAAGPAAGPTRPAARRAAAVAGAALVVAVKGRDGAAAPGDVLAA
ncbi:DUF58 domain-containing protein, partial [Cellulomonas endophytica]|uniref:DUF58 domain-containing protein n=1 Tax=Cellulomonas endophytica TaxID=2494735 RepID=UPI0013E943A4